MFPPRTLLSLAFIAAVTEAGPLSRSAETSFLSLSASVNKDGMLGVVEKDRARARLLQSPLEHTRQLSKYSYTKNASVGLLATVDVGSPASTYALQIDTASAVTWIGAESAYVQTSTSVNTGNSVAVNYSEGYFSGTIWNDTVSFISGYPITQQSIGVASESGGFKYIDGVLAFGPVGLSEGSAANMNTVPTVIENLFIQGKIFAQVLGIYLAPFGILTKNIFTLGGFDPTVNTSAFEYVPVTTESPASRYWGYEQAIHYGRWTILSKTVGIIDTTSSLILIATEAFQRYQSVTGGVIDPATGLLHITEEQYEALEPLSFRIAHRVFELSPDAQIWPRAFNTIIGGNASAIYLIVADLGTHFGQGFDFVVGYMFLQRFYSVYDATNQRIGFATTAYTNSTLN